MAPITLCLLAPPTSRPHHPTARRCGLLTEAFMMMREHVARLPDPGQQQQHRTALLTHLAAWAEASSSSSSSSSSSRGGGGGRAGPVHPLVQTPG